MADKQEQTRPLSPHLQIWRWHITMATSIFHRVTGVGLYGGMLIVAGWAVALAAGPGPYATYTSLLGSPIGLLALLALTLSIFFHLANGVRHLVWDAGEGLDPRVANMTSAAAMAFAVAATIAVWAIAFLTGGL